MSSPLTADDLLPLVANLSQQERDRLFGFLLRKESLSDAKSYASVPAQEDEFPADEDPLTWEAEGWEEFY